MSLKPLENYLTNLDDVTQKIRNLEGVHEINLMVDKPYEKWPLNTISNQIINEF